MKTYSPSDPPRAQFRCAEVPVRVTSTTKPCSTRDIDVLVSRLDSERGAMLTSRYEYPGRYTRWDIGTVNPPLSIEATGNMITVTALNDRGRVLLPVMLDVLQRCDIVDVIRRDSDGVMVSVHEIKEAFMEEDRSKMPHVMNVIRIIRDAFGFDDSRAGLYGIFGYDLGLDFMGVTRSQKRDTTRDMVLYFVDQLFITDHSSSLSYCISYDFDILRHDVVVDSTVGKGRVGAKSDYAPVDVEPTRDNAPGEYAKIVDIAKEYFARGDLFEVVPSYSFHEPCAATPATVFNQLLTLNPAPYGALINLGNGEWTISASPEMFVRVEGDRVESCPIAGTIARGSGDISDAEQIKNLLESKKEESELTMCTDVDRNDKSRVCDPGTIEVIGRRQIEMYSRLIHTVDHVEGYLEKGYDSIDAFLTHMWAVTVTGAPKMSAMKFIEEHEPSARRFYGGAMGALAFDGSMNTGLTLRTIHVHNGAMHIRVGATLLSDSISSDEELETELKASAMLDVVRYCNAVAQGENPSDEKMRPPASNEVVITDKNDTMESKLTDVQVSSTSVSRENSPRVLLIDCEDSFVHTLAGYFRMCGASVHTRRVGFSDEEFVRDINTLQPTLICLSPGPGSPTDFGLNAVIEQARKYSIPIFGVCLGLQALVEYFGGTLSQLDVPMHGKKSSIEVADDGGKLFTGVTSPFEAGRYHSLIADDEAFPKDAFRVTARSSDDNVVMAIEHISEPIAAVQFHPESIMTFEGSTGRRIIQNLLDSL